MVPPTFLSLAGAELAQAAMRPRDSIPKEDDAWDWEWRMKEMQSRSLQSGEGQREQNYGLLEFVLVW